MLVFLGFCIENSVRDLQVERKQWVESRVSTLWSLSNSAWHRKVWRDPTQRESFLQGKTIHSLVSSNWRLRGWTRREEITLWPETEMFRVDLWNEQRCICLGFSDGKESACNARDVGSTAGSGRPPGGGHGNPPPVFLPGESHGQRNLAGYTVHGVAKSRTRLSDSAQHNVTPREGTASSKVPISKREFLITICKHVRLRDVCLIYLYPGPGWENPFMFLSLSVVHWALPGPTLDKTESHIRDFIWIVENSVFIQHSMNVQKVNSI